MLQSYLNMLRIVQMTADETSRIEFKIKVKAVDDPDVVQKVSILGVIHKRRRPIFPILWKPSLPLWGDVVYG